MWLYLYVYVCSCTHFLSLQDEVLTVIRRVDENWAEGMLGDKIGIFPILYVEVNPQTLHTQTYTLSGYYRNSCKSSDSGVAAQTRYFHLSFCYFGERRQNFLFLQGKSKSCTLQWGKKKVMCSFCCYIFPSYDDIHWQRDVTWDVMAVCFGCHITSEKQCAKH